MKFSVRDARFISSLPVYIHPTVTDWAGRVVTNGGAAPTLATKRALTDFMRRLDAYGLTPKMLAVNPHVPDNLTAAITPLIKNIGNDPWTNLGFADGDLTVDGLIGGGSRYLNLGIIPSNHDIDQFDCGITMYVTTNGSANVVDNGCGSSGFSNLFGVNNWGGNSDATFGPAVGGQRAEAAPDPNGYTGYYCGVRGSSTDNRFYRADSTYAHQLVGSYTGATADIHNTVTVPLVEYATNWNGSVQGYSDRRHSFMAVHRSISETDSFNFFTSIQLLRKQLGGGWI